MFRALSRRSFAAAATSLVLTLAGCSESGQTPTERGTEPAAGEDATEPTDSEPPSGSTTPGTGSRGRTTDGASPGATSGTAATDGGLDLREANVVGVEFESTDGRYRFDVSLHHDDDGEDGYANWWQVERLDGTRLGRRELLHAHSRQPFTRSETIEIPDGVTCVVVRGHDQTHGYGGQAMLVDLGSGATSAVQQGAEKQSFSEADCP